MTCQVKSSWWSSDESGTLCGPRPKVETVIDVENIQNGRYSILRITTGDRPGLLTDIVRILKDISVNLVSAEVSFAQPGVTAYL